MRTLTAANKRWILCWACCLVVSWILPRHLLAAETTARESGRLLVSGHSVQDFQRFKYGKVSATAEYPQLDGTGADVAETNRILMEGAHEAVARMVKRGRDELDGPGDHGTDDRYEMEQSYELSRPGEGLYAVRITNSEYTMGAHRNNAYRSHLIDARTGRLLGLDDVFRDDVDWRTRLAEKVHAQLVKEWPEYADRYGDVQKVRETLSRLNTYNFQEGSVILDMGWLFNVVHLSHDVPYAEIKRLLRPGLVKIKRQKRNVRRKNEDTPSARRQR